MIKTVGEMREALKDYSENEPLVLFAGGGAAAAQWFTIESVGHDTGKAFLNIGHEIIGKYQ